MPNRYSCSYPTCPTKLPRSGRCPKHGGRSAYTPYNYGGAWPGIRAAQLRREPACRECGAPATHVDHINPLTPMPGSSMPGTHDQANLQSLCAPCHRRKTGIENEKRIRGVAS